MGPPRFGKDYKWYKNPATWGMDYATDPTFYGNQKQPCICLMEESHGYQTLGGSLKFDRQPEHSKMKHTFKHLG